MTASQNVLVAGAGLIGLCTAYSLARAGHRVTLIDKEEVGAGAARGNAGEITRIQATPMPEPEQLTEIFKGVTTRRHYLNIAPVAMPLLSGFGAGFIYNTVPSKVRENTRNLDQLVRGAFAAFDSYHEDGISLDGGGFGFLNSHVSADALQKFRDGQVRRADLFGIERPGQIMLDSDLHDFEPVLDEHVRAGFVANTERYIDPRLFIDELHEKLLELDVEILEHTELVGLNNNTATMRGAEGETARGFDKAIVATGAWTTPSIEGLSSTRSAFVTSGTGYSYHVKPERLPGYLLASIDRKTIGVPMSGELRVVGLMDFSSEIQEFSAQRVEHLASQASAFIKGIGDKPRFDEWTGPRPMTPNGLPIISPTKQHPNVIVATGHNMHGLSLGPVTAEVVVSMVEGRPGVVSGSEIDMKPFAL
ncbi:MAG: FAD-binding oxidoreductase [Yaniella sp.]|uniref:NAD(P)/FAD-dependent oxidoreductase n=1 Tax=Yaniella sp. TaxID=2773929 RepID=UPI002648C6E8|nr:FAD-binding oxidoreductase [Yaniella sp.]MDN5704052.1 FAD-binding oxidoreductase [Yaniella sp.]MDN5817940.1 FAD-binding oxidoreductase [Yaniella sp.]MDN5838219.1 FAD-binding oxidoreductase [Yaniella sp.]MDN5912154.1 FAD-binding oxidoreductase [Yaniella sp.]MDN6150062.1 FAD-binding oxidoreductase [Yaniella sp.]